MSEATGSETATKNPKRNDAVIVNDDPDAPSLLNPMNGEIYVTNEVGKRIMGLADGTLSVKDIVGRILAEFKGASEEVVSAEVETFLADGSKKGLVDWV